MDTTTQPQPHHGQLPPPPPGAPRSAPPPPPPPPRTAPAAAPRSSLPLPTGVPVQRIEPVATRPAEGCALPASSRDEVRRLLADRARLGEQLAALDAGGERLTRAVQRVGGVTSAGRPFTAAPPLRVDSSSELDGRIRQLSDEMQELTATISGHELQLQDLERPPRRRRVLAVLMTLVVIAAVAGAIVLLAVR